MSVEPQVAFETPETTPPWHDLWRRFAADRAALAGLIVLTITVFGALLAPWVVRDVLYQSAYRQHIMERVAIRGREVDVVSEVGVPIGPNAHFPLGADLVGRDVLSRTLYGARMSLLVAGLGTLLALIVGLAAACWPASIAACGTR